MSKLLVDRVIVNINYDTLDIIVDKLATRAGQYLSNDIDPSGTIKETISKILGMKNDTTLTAMLSDRLEFWIYSKYNVNFGNNRTKECEVRLLLKEKE